MEWNARRLGLLLLLGVPAPLSAQMGIAARGSTLGVGAELSIRAAKYLGFRLGGNYLQFSRDITVESNRYTATPHFENGTAILDLYPFGGAFHLSGGAILNYNEGKLSAHEPFTFNGRTYSSDQVTKLTANVTFKHTAPYVGIGFAGQGRFAFLFDLGVGFTGKPLATLSAETSLTGAERTEFDTKLQEEQDRVRDEIDSRSYLRYHPVVSIGFKIGF
jgi:hypothetical protein